MSSIIVIENERRREVSIEPGETLLETLRRGGYAVGALCGGNGTCGKCGVTLLCDGAAQTVLSCETAAQHGMQVLWTQREGDICVDSEPAALSDGGRGCGAAVDLGTTTVALRLYERATGRLLSTKAAWNAQAPYGADVITRAQHTMEKPEGLAELQSVIKRQIQELLAQACGEAGVAVEAVEELYVAGNTVMEHLLAGLSPATIAVAPFTPLSLFERHEGLPLGGAVLRCAPCVAGYVGGDITAGLLSAELFEQEGRWLFLDVGTNGEMALGGRGGFVSCAVASGPAFEGAGIECGMTGTQGAVSHIRWENGAPVYEVIGGGAPTGFCGSGLLDLLAMLLELGLVDETGLLLPPDEAPEGFEDWLEEDEDGNGLFRLSREEGAPYLTARDVRQLQLAKAAVAAGIAVLLEQEGLDVQQLSGAVLAGGFGSRLDSESAIAIGMLPRALSGRIRAVGNASLAGASQALLSAEKRRRLEDVRAACRYLELSGHASFNRFYPQCMSFDEEDAPWN